MGDLDAFVNPEEGLRVDDDPLPFDLRPQDASAPKRDVIAELLPAARAAAARRELNEQSTIQQRAPQKMSKVLRYHRKSKKKTFQQDVSKAISDVPEHVTGSTHVRSLLSRYNDVPDYAQNAYHPRDFNYHRPESCGPRGEGTLDESFFQNGIICDFLPYQKFSEANPATDEEKATISDARRKACNCEVERKLTREHMKALSTEQDLYEHVFPLNKATLLCKQCAQIERDILKYGYLKDKQEVERHDAVTALMMAMHELNTMGEQYWKDCPGVTRFDKITKYLWDIYLPKQPVLKNLKKSMPFSEFRLSLAAVDIFLREKALNAELVKNTKIRESKLSRYEKRRQKIVVLDNRRQIAVKHNKKLHQPSARHKRRSKR